MIALLAFLIRLAAIGIIMSGAFVASQKAGLESADILLIGLSLIVSADVLEKTWSFSGNDRREKPTLPKSDL